MSKTTDRLHALLKEHQHERPARLDRAWSRGGFTPRAGIADPRLPLAPEPSVPPRPNVREPAVWSWPVQQISSRASYLATEGMIEEERGELPPGELLHAHNLLSDRLKESLPLRREFYKRAVHLMSQVIPSDGYSEKGPAVDRAEAKLFVWLRVFEND